MSDIENNSQEVDYEKLISVLPEIKPGSVIAVRAGSMSHFQLIDFMRGIRGVIEDHGIYPVIMVPLFEGVEFNILNEEQMRVAGWARIPAQSSDSEKEAEQCQ